MTHPPLTLGDVLADPAKLANVAPEALPGLLVQANTLATLLLSKLVAAGIPVVAAAPGNSHPDAVPAAEAPPMLTVHEASKRLHMSADWCYRHARDLGAVKVAPGALRFPQDALDRYIARKRADTDSPTAA